MLTEGEGFHGESWTVQCEVLQGNLLGRLPLDEVQAPGPDDFPPGGPFDLFGLGQQGPSPVAFPPVNDQQHMGPNPFQGGPRNQNNEPMEAKNVWDAWPDNEQVIPGLNLNILAEVPQHLDLNVAPDMQQVIIDLMEQHPQ